MQVKRFLCMVFVVVAALSLGACTSTANQAAAREKAATKLTCAEVNVALRDTTIHGSNSDKSLAEIMKNATRSANPSLVSDARQMQEDEDLARSHPKTVAGPDVAANDLVNFLRTCDSLGLGASL